MRRSLAALLVLCGCAHAANHTRQTPEPPPEDVITATVRSPAQIVAGSASELVVSFRVAPGYHVMSDQPSRPVYIATRVTFDPADGLAFGPARFPPAKQFALGGERIATFDGEVTIRIPFGAAASAQPGFRTLHGALGYQACSHDGCLFPTARELVAKIEVVR